MFLYVKSMQSKKSHKSKSKIADADNDNEAHSKRSKFENFDFFDVM